MKGIEDLVLQAQLGNKQAYEELYARFRDMALSYSLSIVGDYDLAEDARQDAFTDAYCDLLSLRNPRAFPKWFKRIVFNSAVNVGRRRKLSVPLDEAEHVASGEAGADERLSRDEQHAKIRGALGELPPVEAEAVRRFYLDEQSIAEIGEELGLSVSAVKSKLHMARGRLRNTLMGRAKQKLKQGTREEKQLLLGSAAAEAAGQYAGELAKLLAVEDAAGRQKIIDMICAQARLYRFLGKIDDAMGALARGLKLDFVRANELFTARLRAERGLTLIQTSDYREARRELRAAEKGIEGNAEQRGLLAAILNGAGVCHWGEGAFRKAREFYEKSLEVGRGKLSPLLIAETHNNLALLDWKAGELNAARRHFETCLTQWKKAKCPYGAALTLMNLGIVEENLGHSLKAERNYHKALEAARKQGYAQVEAATQSNLANLALQLNDWKGALSLGVVAVELARKIKDRRSEAIALENLGAAELGSGNAGAAAKHIQAARVIAKRIGDREREFSLDLLEVEAQIGLGKIGGLEEKFAALRKTLSAEGYGAERPRLLTLQAQGAHAGGDLGEAKRLFAKALAESRAQGNRAAERKARALMDAMDVKAVRGKEAARGRAVKKQNGMGRKGSHK